jgi:hypothetical protein
MTDRVRFCTITIDTPITETVINILAMVKGVRIVAPLYKTTLIAVLDQPTRTDDFAIIGNTLKMMRNVISIEPIVQDGSMLMTYSQCRSRFNLAILDWWTTQRPVFAGDVDDFGTTLAAWCDAVDDFIAIRDAAKGRG